MRVAHFWLANGVQFLPFYSTFLFTLSSRQITGSPNGGSVRGYDASAAEHVRINYLVLQHCEFYSANRRQPRWKNAQNQVAAPPYIYVRRIKKFACDNHPLDGERILVSERDFSD